MSFLSDETIRRHGLTTEVAAATSRERAHRQLDLVAAAVADGRILPDRRDYWLCRLATDPQAEAVLANLAAPSTPPGAWPGL